MQRRFSLADRSRAATFYDDLLARVLVSLPALSLTIDDRSIGEEACRLPAN